MLDTEPSSNLIFFVLILHFVNSSLVTPEHQKHLLFHGLVSRWQAVLGVEFVMPVSAEDTQGSLWLSSCFADGQSEAERGLVISRTLGQ